MTPDDSFGTILARLRGGDDDAAAVIVGRFLHRLLAMASAQFPSRLRSRADPEGLVQSALASFFDRYGRGQFVLDDWGELWCLLTVITLRKCSKRGDYLRARRRDVRRELGWDLRPEIGPEMLDREPTPEEAAVLAETVHGLLRGLEPREHRVVELTLEGYTAEEVARRSGCSERTVWRVRERARTRLRRLQEAEAAWD